MTKWVVLWLVILLSSCGKGAKQEDAKAEDVVAKTLLQGVWLDDETEMPLMRIKGDSIYYADTQNAPVYFKVIKDTLYYYGNNPTSYKIDRQTETVFWFHSLADVLVKLHKSDNPEDILTFTNAEVATPVSKVTQKDSVVMYNGTRYRGYAYINPTQMKVMKTSYSEEGINMDNVYYDNVIHICVYEGKKMLYGKDINKQMFLNVLPASLLKQTILSDMNFMGVDKKGYHYQATLTIPESSASNLINLTIDANKRLIIKKAE